jgi:two-component system sensor histidine kinase BaeS
VDNEIVGDEIRLKQVFSNLIENALRYMNTPGMLTISQNQTDGNLVIIFEDSGPGVPQDALLHLFDRLYRADPSRNRKTGGSGIGLSICKTIIDGHNGTITAENVEGGGLKIQISLPITNNVA